MKVVLDTNVLISGIFFSGPPSEILRAWQKGIIRIITSEQILSEYQRVADELQKQFPDIHVDNILELLTIHSEVVDTKRIKITECVDLDDNKFFECAIVGKCYLIISGDKHLLKLSGYQEISVLKPREFLDKYLK